MAGPLFDQEGLLYSDLDLGKVARVKLGFDVVRLYAWPKVFQLIIDERPKPPVVSKVVKD